MLSYANKPIVYLLAGHWVTVNYLTVSVQFQPPQRPRDNDPSPTSVFQSGAGLCGPADRRKRRRQPSRLSEWGR